MIEAMIFLTDAIPELRDVEQDHDGNFIGEDGQIVKWYEDPRIQLALSFAFTFLSIIFSLLQFWLESIQLQEDMYTYWLNRIKGGFGWIPFEAKYQSKDTIDQSLDYLNIKCMIPGITSKIAMYEIHEYIFTNASCQNLT